ncbi:MAG: alpha/beta hydrolase [Gammaproteobacteria bacterium]|nr:alpha/beta hydrolase [Gammaproteobacteria bacterium]
MSLHPQIVEFLNRMAGYGFRPTQELDPEEARAQYLRTIAVRKVVPPPIGATEDIAVPGPGGPIPVRLYRPADVEGPLPVLVYYHGGGHVIGSIETHEAITRALANGASCLVASVDYRLAPESKFPAAAEDSFVALQWIAANAGKIGADATRIAVGGDSAGGNLAAVATLMAREAGEPALVLQLLVYPVTDFACNTPSYATYASGFGSLQAPTMHWFRDHYLRGPGDAADWRAAPLQAARLDDLPPACILLAQCDVLRDEGAAYAERLTAAGVPVEEVEYPGMIHGFFALAPLIDDAVAAQAKASAALRAAFKIAHDAPNTA